ncbi:UDP-N-acetyl-D-mannosaminuronic acid dehydrogenase [Caloramator quimbayensis]|uniref:UDP-N-acetyl-D-mannosaminuronic acid dehydrogenase n=2 Tax=Caloramator quimbayensis TaxID=1147123 RepID=A0A1T4XHN6_9CLOT|nr:UDP-N-acetyl-D-mannosaminuronic acid dehydrogenase [Caloramator quimbayensis]
MRAKEEKMETVKTFNISELNENIPEKSLNKKVCVFGQGFVGLPLTLSFALRGCNTIGVDVDKNLVDEINSGITHHTEKFYDVTIQKILKMQLEEKRYKAVTDAAKAVKECNNIIVTVGIPIKDGKHDMSYLESAVRTIGKNLKKEDLIVIRSTVIPGTTEEFILPILEEESKLKAGVDFYLAYSSERIAEGNAFEEFANMPTLVAGINKPSLYRAVDLLSVVCKADIIISNSIKAVETSKVVENAQRDVNIAMVQEVARFCEALNIDVFEVIRLANTHKRVNLLAPGPGVGGYCIPNAYHYLEPKAKELNVDLDLFKLSREKNRLLPEFIVNKIEEQLNNVGKNLENSKVAVLGLAMKDFSNDDRISPPIDICNILIRRGALVSAFDPQVPTEYDFKVKMQDEALKDADAVVILTKQKGITFDDYEYMAKLMKNRPVIIDTKNIINETEAKKYGFKWWRI